MLWFLFEKHTNIINRTLHCTLTGLRDNVGNYKLMYGILRDLELSFVVYRRIRRVVVIYLIMGSLERLRVRKENYKAAREKRVR